MNFRRRFRPASRSADDIRRDVDDEFAFHLATRAEALEREGLSPDAARTQAAAEFGDRTAGHAACVSQDARAERRRRLAVVFGECQQDVRYGARILLRSPGFAVAALATLTIAIGANTAVFSLVNALLLKPVPVAEPDELLRIQTGQRTVSWPVFQALRERTAAFDDIVAFSTEFVSLGDPGSTRGTIGEAVSRNYFATMGIGAARGRTLGAADAGLQHVVLSDRTWRVYFNADESIVGRRITLDHRPFEVVGIMPPLFRGLTPPGFMRAFWVPIEAMPSHRRRLEDPAAASFEIVGRLRDGVSAGQAAAAVRVAVEQIRRDDPRVPESITSVSLAPVTGLAQFRGVGVMMPVFIFVAMLMVLAAFVLLIGCANIAGLLIGRAAARRQEIAVRVALGAGRGRVIRQMLTESLLLAVAGGASGILLAAWLTGFVHVALEQLPYAFEFDLTVDWRIFGYTMLVSVLAAVVFGLAPARGAAHADVVSALKDDPVSGRRQRGRQLLIVGQVAACGVLLTWAMLFSRSLINVTAVDPGFDQQGVLLAEVVLGLPPDAAAEQRVARFRQLQETVEAMPSVRSAGFSWAVPLALSSRESFSVFLDGDERGSRGRRVVSNRLTPGWFDALKIPVLAGRDFTWNDKTGTPEVAIVNQMLAQRFWNGDAIGQRLRFTGRRDQQHDVRVVGVVGDSKYWTLGEDPEPAVYLPVAQDAFVSDDLTMHIRTSNAEVTAKALGHATLRVAPAGFVQFRAMADATAVSMMPARVAAAVTAAFAGIAVLLATLGIYGLVSYTVVQRTREIGVRKAIGAGTGDILRMVLRGSLRVTGIGLLAGFAVAAAGAPLIASLVVGVSPVDPVTLGAAAALVACSVVAASAGPALRAARVDPLRALRNH
jgi:predicted permease